MRRRREWGTLSVIKHYIKYRKAFILLYFLMVGVSGMIQYLNGFSLEPVWCSFEVSGFIFLVVGGIDFYLFQKQYGMLQNILKENNIYINKLPKARNNIEESYEKIILLLVQLALHNVNELQQTHKEQIDYYTLWVHQIKTPISAIRLITGEEEQTESIKKVEQELFKIEQYVEMVLQYLRIQSLSSDLVLQPCPLLPIIKQCIKKYSSIFIYKKLSVTICVEEVSVITDEKWLAFLLEQILSNALKYTKEGGITITFEEHPQEYWLCIQDTGIGIRKEDQNRIFEKGYTGYNGRMDKKASGIGLYLTKQVADKLNHSIEIQSEVNKGTSVIIGFKRHVMQGQS